ncbi:hypothetical protein QWY84_05745 [Aquisalimonas lutea]|uniref:hypothetical protein n=1 Tax=Aquisalimonas lutea TaxID=1327750 RepID=UPI0025B42521|nr:hypothetical protein [Aquisalimonas lutea]MDN3517107.1 hypothetical protein [Aquisalimonas lutea]
MATDGIPVRAALAREWPVSDAPENRRGELEALTGRRQRRISRFTQIALLGAVACVDEARARPAPETGLYMVSSHGDVGDSATMLETLYRGHQPPMPFDFINVSSNMAGFYVARELGLDGPNMMLARGTDSLVAALELLGDDAAHAPFLVGAVEAASWPPEVHRRRLQVAAGTPLAEASCWLWLDPGCARPVGHLRWLRRVGSPEAALQAAAATGDGGRLLLTLGEQLAAAGAMAAIPDGWARFAPEGPGYHEAGCARVLCRFLASGEPGTLLFLERHPLDRDYLAVCVTNRSSSA